MIKQHAAWESEIARDKMLTEHVLATTLEKEV